MLESRFGREISSGEKDVLGLWRQGDYLKRISFGEFKLDEGMAVGSYRALTEAEKAILRTYLG